MENREIKFRAWNGVKMHYLEDEMFWLIGKSKYFELQDHRAEHYDTVESINGHKDLAILNNCDNEQIVLMQSTGLVDKNGVEIYEGDIIARTTIPDRYVIFKDGGFQTKSINNPLFITHINIDGFDVVIGNIYQSPELLTTPKH